MTAARSMVGTFRRKGTFRPQHAAKSGRARQDTPLPPRCRDCRLPGIYGIQTDRVIEFFCDKHVDGRE